MKKNKNDQLVATSEAKERKSQSSNTIDFKEAAIDLKVKRRMKKYLSFAARKRLNPIMNYRGSQTNPGQSVSSYTVNMPEVGEAVIRWKVAEALIASRQFSYDPIPAEVDTSTGIYFELRKRWLLAGQKLHVSISVNLCHPDDCGVSQAQICFQFSPDKGTDLSEDQIRGMTHELIGLSVDEGDGYLAMGRETLETYVTIDLPDPLVDSVIENLISSILRLEGTAE